MNRTANSTRPIGPRLSWVVTTAMAGALLSGCATSAAPRADISANRAEVALSQGKHRQAVAQAEAAVLAEPHNAAYRAMLGNAYLNAGRFNSAATSFTDAMSLGDTSPRTVLSLSLAKMGEGKFREAGSLLNGREDQIAAADLGLALALSGQTEHGINIMSSAIRGGQNNAKTRQNLAYAYALAGRWREARLMAAQDVPADKLGDRIEQWAMTTQADAWQTRIAGLLEVPVGVADAGQPVQLALANNPSVEQLAAEAATQSATPTGGELPALASTYSAEPVTAPELPALALAPLPAATAPVQHAYVAPEPAAPANFATAFAAPAPAPAPDQARSALASVTLDANRFASASQTDAAPLRKASMAERRAGRDASTSVGSHLIQLGSFSSEQSAKRAWSIYVGKYPELANHQMVITEAEVRGRHFWRVSAGNYDRASSASMCGKVKSGGAGCFAYAASRPLPGAVDRGIRLARN